MLDRAKDIVRHTPLYPWIWHARMCRETRSWTPYDEQMKTFYGQFMGSGDMVLDVGANVGNRAKIFKALDVRVVAVEPQSKCMRVLRSCFGGSDAVVLVPKALGEVEGSAKMKISDSHTLSSLSQEWISAVKDSGRFRDSSWAKTETVPVTTLDKLIEEHGRPAFIKVDVEGFEYQVIMGLSQAVPAVSLEFTPEILGPTFECMDHLGKLAELRCNYSLDTVAMVLDEWVGLEAMKDILSSHAGDNHLYGDVYLKSLSAPHADG